MLEAWGPFEWWGNCYCLNCRWFHHIIQMLNSLHCLSLYYVVQFHSILWTVFSSSFNLNFSNSKCVNSCFYFCMSHLLCKWLALYPNKKNMTKKKEDVSGCLWFASRLYTVFLAHYCIMLNLYNCFCSVSVFGISPESMQCSYDTRGNSVPTILLLMQERLYSQDGLKVSHFFYHFWFMRKSPP